MLRPASLRRSNQEGDGFSVATPQSTNRNQSWYRKLCRTENPALYREEEEEGQEETLQTPSPQRLQLQMLLQREYQQRQELQKNCRQDWWQRKSGPSPGVQSHAGSFHTPTPVPRVYPAAPPFYLDGSYHQHTPRPSPREQPLNSPLSTTYLQQASADGPRRNVNNLEQILRVCPDQDKRLEQELMLKAAHVIKHDTEKRMREAQREYVMPAPNEQDSIQRKILQLLTEHEMAEKYRQASQTPRTARPPPSQTPDLQHKIAKLLQAYQQVPTHQLPATYQTRQDQVATYNNMLQAYRQGNLEQSYQQAKLLLHQLLIKEPTTLIPKEPNASQVSFAPGFYPPHQAYYPQQTPPQYGASGMQPVFRTPYPPRPPVRIRRDPRLNQSTQQYQARDLDITPRLNQSTYQVSEHDLSQERLYQTGNGRKPRNCLLNSTAHDEYSFEDENGNILPKQDRKRQFEHPGKDNPPTTPAPKKDVRPSPGQQQGQKLADPGSAPTRSSSAGRRQAESSEGVTRPGTDLLTHDWEQLQQRSQYLCRGRRVHPHQQTEEGDQKKRKESEETRKGPNVSSTETRDKKITTSDQTKLTNDDGQSPGKSSASQAEAQAKKTSASYQKEEEDQGEKTPKLSSVLSTETQDQKQLSESFDKSAYVQNQTKMPSTESLDARKSSEVQVREKATGPKPVQATEPDIKVTAAEHHPPRDSQEESKHLKDPQQAHCDPQQPPRDSQPSLGTQRSSRNTHQFTRGHQQLPPQNHRQLSESRQRQSRNKGESRGDAKSPSGTVPKPGNARSPGSTAPKSSDANPQGGSSLSTFTDPKSATSKPASGAPSEKAVNKKSPGSTSSLSSNRPKPAAAKSPSGQVKKAKAETSPPTFRPRRRGTRRRPAQRDTPGCQSEDLSPRSQPQSRDRNRHQEPQQSRRSSSPRRWQDRRHAWSPTARRRPHQTDWDDTSAGPAKKIRAVGQQGGNRSLEVNARREHQHEISESRKEKHASEGPLKKSPRPEPLRTAGKPSRQKTETPKSSGRSGVMPNDKACEKGRSAQDEQRRQTDEKQLDMRSAVTDRTASKPDTPEARRVDNGTYESPKDTRHESARDMSCDDPPGHILSTHASGDEPSLTTGKLEPGASNSSDDLTEKCEASECEEHAAPKHEQNDAPPCSRKGALCSDESGAGSGDGAGEKHDVHSHASASVATGETSESQLQTRDSVVNGELQIRACLQEDGGEEKSEDKTKHAGEEILESQNRHQNAEEAKPEVQTEHEDAVNPIPEAQAEHEDAVDTQKAQAENEDAVNPTPEAQAEHQDAVNPTPEAQAEHEDAVNPTPEAQAEHEDAVNPTPEAQAEQQDAVNPTPEAQAEHQDTVNPTPEAQAEHEDAVKPTPETQAEHEDAVKPTPEAQAEHQAAINPTPEAQAEHQDTVNPTAEAQAEHEDAVKPTPEAQAEHEDAVKPTPEAQAEHQAAVNPTPEAQAEHEDAVNQTPEAQAEHQDAVNPTPEAQAEHQDAVNPTAEAQAEHEDAVNPTPEAQAEHQDAVNPTPEAQAEHQDTVNPAPEAQAEHEDAVKPTPETQAEHEDAVKPTPEAQAEHQAAINPTPEAQAEHQDTVNPTAEAQAEHEDAVKPTPEAQAEHEDAVKPTPEAQAEHQAAVNPTPEAQAEHEDAVNQTPEAQAEHQDAVNPTPEAQAEHQDAVNPTAEAQAEHEDAVNPTPEAQAEHQDAVNPTPEAQAEHQDTVNPAPEAQAEHEDAVKPTPETQAEHEDAVKPTPEAQAEHQAAVNPTPEAQAEHQDTVNPTAEAQAEHEDAVKPTAEAQAEHEDAVNQTPEAQAEHQDAVNPTPEAQAEHQAAVNPTPEAQAGHEDAVNQTPEAQAEHEDAVDPTAEAQAEHEDAVNPTPEAQTEHQDTEDEEAEAGTKPQDSAEEMLEGQTGNDDAVDQNPETGTGHHHAVAEKSELPSELGDAGLGHPPTYGPRDGVVEEPVTRLEHVLAVLAGMKSVVEADEETEARDFTDVYVLSSRMSEREGSAGTGAASSVEPEDMSVDDERSGEDSAADASLASSPAADQDERPPTTSEELQQQQQHKPGENPEQHQSSPDPEAVDKSTNLETREEPDKNPEPEVPDKNPEQRQSSPDPEAVDKSTNLETREEPDKNPEPEVPDKNPEQRQSSPTAETLDSGAPLETREEPEEPDENPKQHQSFSDPEAADKSTDLETREELEEHVENPKQRQSSPKAETLDSGADLATQEELEAHVDNPKQHQSFPDPEAADKSTDLETREEPEEPDENPEQRQSSPTAETLDSGADLATREEPEEPDENRERCEPSSPGAEHKTASTQEVAQPERTQRDGTVKAEPRSEPLYTKPADETGEDGEHAPVVHDAAAAHPLTTGSSGRAYAAAATGSLATDTTAETYHKDVAEAAKQCEMTRREKMEAAHDTVLLQIQTSDDDDDADADMAVGEPAAPDVSAKTKPAAAASGTCSYRETPHLFPESPAIECSKAVTTDPIDPAVDGPTATEMASLDAVEECGKGTISSCALHEVPSKDATDSPAALTAQQLVGNPEEDTAGRAVAEENGTELERNLNNNVIDQNDLAANGKPESENNTSKTEMTREQSDGGEGVPEDTGDEREDDDVAEKVLSTQEGTPGGLAGTERLGKEETAGESASCQNACCRRLRPTLDLRPTDGDVTVGKVLVDRLTVNGII